MWRFLRRFIRDDRGAVAPTIALSLIGLISAGGLAFDYAHLVAMDTELQQAADQAALAAATQLDRSDGSRDRATRTIQDATNSHRLAVNFTRFANDGDSPVVSIASITFCKSFDDSVASTATACDSSGVDDTNAAFVVVTTSVRTADYAFTPVVAAFSGTSFANAVAGVQSDICNVQPLLVCAPSNDWPTSDDVGEGVLLKPFDTKTPWAPGNWGLLDFGNGTPGVINALQGFGLNGCQDTLGTDTEPGVKEVTDAINTRLDYYAGTNVCDPSTGYGCPSLNNQKDMARTETYVIDTDPTVTATPAAPSCGQSGTGFPGTLTVGASFQYSSAAASYTRDDCHYTNDCTGGNIGDGDWDYDAYMTANHPGVTSAQTGGTTRYAVYQWELANDLAARAISSTMTSEAKKIKGKDRKVWTFTKQCAFRNPVYGSAAYPTQKDRRLLTILAADCTNLHGKGSAYEDFVILRAFDVFITEPSLDRTTPHPTDNKEIYAEIVGPAQPVAGGSGFQYYARAKPYLVR